MAYWGYHLSADCAGCNPDAIRDYDTLYRFAKALVERIDMIAYGEPQIVKFGSSDKVGFTLLQLIETSNICAHFVDESNELYLDVFSCKPYDIEIVDDTIREFFGPTSIRRNFITRQA